MSNNFSISSFRFILFYSVTKCYKFLRLNPSPFLSSCSLMFKYFHLSIVCCLVTKSCPTLLRPHVLYSPLGPSVHVTSQAIILEWVTISFSRGSSWPRNRTHTSWIAVRFFTIRATRKAVYSLPLYIWLTNMYLWHRLLVLIQEFSGKKKKKPRSWFWLI